jgi:hypothetical protein
VRGAHCPVGINEAPRRVKRSRTSYRLQARKFRLFVQPYDTRRTGAANPSAREHGQLGSDRIGDGVDHPGLEHEEAEAVARCRQPRFQLREVALA